MAREVLITHDGKTRTKTAWARSAGLNPTTFNYRVGSGGQDMADALRPARKRNSKKCPECGVVFFATPTGNSTCGPTCGRKMQTRSKIKHGQTGKTLYRRWVKMRYTTRNNTTEICSEWDDYERFARWSEENGYEDGLALVLKDPAGDYSPINCRWVKRGVRPASKFGSLIDPKGRPGWNPFGSGATNVERHPEEGNQGATSEAKGQ